MNESKKPPVWRLILSPERKRGTIFFVWRRILPAMALRCAVKSDDIVHHGAKRYT